MEVILPPQPQKKNLERFWRRKNGETTAVSAVLGSSSKRFCVLGFPSPTLQLQDTENAQKEKSWLCLNYLVKAFNWLRAREMCF